MLCHRSFFDVSQTNERLRHQPAGFAIDHFSMSAKPRMEESGWVDGFAIDHFSMSAKPTSGCVALVFCFAIDHFSMSAKPSAVAQAAGEALP